MKTETLLMVNLTFKQEIFIRRLLRTFNITPASVKGFDTPPVISFLKEKEICLVLIHAYSDREKTLAEISRAKKALVIQVPVLVLLTQDLSDQIHVFLKAGADDYFVMPWDEDSFAMRFYVLLESGQAILETRQGNAPDKDTKPLILEYLHQGIRFFAPKSQLARKTMPPISRKWEHVRKIAAGGDAEIWLVKDENREAVAKIPHSPHLNINSLRCAAVLKRLVYHPNIVHLIEVLKEDEKFILIQEHIKGQTLSGRFESPMSGRQKEDIFLQLLSVVSYAHEHGIMHRDIKPDNIMVTDFGKVKLLDFGSARKVTWVETGPPSQGTLNFMAPEQIKGSPCLASDVWAMGVVLYIFSVNRLPLCQDNRFYPMDIETDVMVKPPGEIISGFPVKLEQIIMTCLETSLEKRYENANALYNDLFTKLPGFGQGQYIPEDMY
ncbi:MAG: protein kinase [Desulfobacteraceae bacterium]